MDEDQHQHVSILRIGPFHQDSDCTEALRRAILSHHATLQPRAKTTQEGHNNNEDPQHHKQDSTYLDIINKYFSARVLLQDMDSHETPVEQTMEDGIILVFDHVLSNGKASIASSSFQAVSSRFEQQQQKHGEMMRLCVGVGSMPQTSSDESSTQEEADFSARVLWCLDHGFEYVRADLAPHALQQGHEERDKHGFARIMEAIYGTMWSSAVMHKNIHSGKSNLLNVVRQNNEESEASPSKVDMTTARDDHPRQNNNITIAEPPQLDDTPDEAFDEAVQQARRIRELSKTSDMSEEQRKKRASDAANLIFNMMSQMGIHDEDKEDDEDYQQDGQKSD